MGVRINGVAVIAGAAGGIGSALGQRFLANEDTVLAMDVNRERLPLSTSFMGLTLFIREL